MQKIKPDSLFFCIFEKRINKELKLPENFPCYGKFIKGQKDIWDIGIMFLFDAMEDDVARYSFFSVLACSCEH